MYGGLIEGEIRNNNYEKDGVKHYSNQVVVNSFEFCESKGTARSTAPQQTSSDGFMNLDGIDDSELPFN